MVDYSIIMKLVRKLVGPILRSEPLKALFQRRAAKQAEKISKGLKVEAPRYEANDKILSELLKDETIKQKLRTKDEGLIEKLDQIEIKSVDPPEPKKSQRQLPKRPEEYLHGSKEEYEYGFMELPLDKMETDKLMLREAVEILRARIELVQDEEGQDLPLFAQTNSYLESHPAVSRVDREKMELVWRYFRPFARRREQFLASKEQLDTIQNYIEGAHSASAPMTMLENAQQIGQKIKEYVPTREKMRAIGKKEEDIRDMEAVVDDVHKKEYLRLQKRLEDMKKLDEEVKRDKDGDRK